MNMPEIHSGMLVHFLTQNQLYVNRITKSRKCKWIFAFSPRLRKLYKACQEQETPENENEALGALLNAFEESMVFRIGTFLKATSKDLSLFWSQIGKRKTIDCSDKGKMDYYSVAVILKNEARYIREFILFYLATGADRIYLYDNDSTDDLMQEIDPFVKSGEVVYRKWPGQNVQTGAYRDVVRRTRRRTRWLAIIDSDEFLFSPKGPMPEQLKAYEEYPGIGVNWVLFGPNGHDQRPQGLVMDQYTTTPADYNCGMNCHIKSIVQPKEVFSVNHTHFALYKGKKYAVGEDFTPLDNTTNRAFSRNNHHEIMRINHYMTKSLEDLREKCRRGYADGVSNAVFSHQLNPFEDPLIEDYSIKPYANLVRKKI